MGYIEDNLLKDETVIYRTKLHWVIFLFPILVVIIGFFAFLENKREAGLITIFIGLLLSISAAVSFLTSEFAVTNKRVIIKVGFISRRTLELLLPKVETISVNQSILGRILGYGTIVVVGTGGTKEPFANISNPLQFHRHVQATIPQYQETHQPTQA